MSGCLDKRFEEMLYAYELGLLDEPDEKALEIHLLECEACFEKVRGMSRAADLLRNSEKIRSEILADQAATETTELESRHSSPRRWSRYLPVSLAAAAVLIFLLLQPWDIQIKPTQEAVASENRLLVPYFRNLVDPSDTTRLGEIAANLLITDLSESRFVDVVSNQRLYDLSRLEGFDDPRGLDRGTASEIARKARARWMLLGDVLQVTPRLEVTVQIVDVTSDMLIASRSVTGGDNEDIFSLVDRLSTDVKSALALPLAALDEPDRRVADVTTRSTEAYRWYLIGLENLNKVYNSEAIAAFEKALEYDSTMAMAHYNLAMIKDRAHLEKAVEYSAGTSRKERAYIMALKTWAEQNRDSAIVILEKLIDEYPEEKEARLRLAKYLIALGREPEAIVQMEKAVELDPLYKSAYNQLAYSYLNTGNYEKSLVAINKYVELAPDEANPYDSRGDICAAAGRLDDAIASYRKALEIKPDFAHSLMYLGYMYLFNQEYDLADSCLRAYTEAADGPYLRSAGRLYQAYIPVHRGRFDEALRLLDEYLAADSLEAQPELTYDHRAEKRLLKALVYRARNDYDQAVAEILRCMALYRTNRPDDRWAYQYIYAQFLAEAGRLDQADSAANEMKAYLQSVGQTELSEFWYADGCIRMARGNYEEAVVSLAKARETSSRFYTVYMLGRAYLETGRLEGSVDEFEKLLRSYSSDRAYWGIWAVETHYYLGRAYEESRWYDKAAEQYGMFLDKWKDADPSLAILDDARLRLARLEARP